MEALEEFGSQSSSEQNRAELDIKIEGAKETLRRAEVMRERVCVCVGVLERKWLCVRYTPLS